MSSLNTDIQDDETSANPLDLVEKLAVANDWPYHRQTRRSSLPRSPASGATTGSGSPGTPSWA